MDDLVDTFRDTPRALGLSAVQIGEPLRAFVMRWGDGLMLFTNPVIAWSSVLNESMAEECMSFPWLTPVRVLRPREIVLQADDFSGHLDGIEARVALHELDHCNGITIDLLRRHK